MSTRIVSHCLYALHNLSRLPRTSARVRPHSTMIPVTTRRAPLLCYEERAAMFSREELPRGRCGAGAHTSMTRTGYLARRCAASEAALRKLDTRQPPRAWRPEAHVSSRRSAVSASREIPTERRRRLRADGLRRNRHRRAQILRGSAILRGTAGLPRVHGLLVGARIPALAVQPHPAAGRARVRSGLRESLVESRDGVRP